MVDQIIPGVIFLVSGLLLVVLRNTAVERHAQQQHKYFGVSYSLRTRRLHTYFLAFVGCAFLCVGLLVLAGIIRF